MSELADQRIVFRIGVNLGDIVVDDDDIHGDGDGDGVNVGARLEALSNPGGVCVSDSVYDQVRDRSAAVFKDLGAQQLKNIDRAVQAWQWMPDASLVIKAPSDAVAALTPEPASGPGRNKPTVAVLPFNVFGGTADTEFLADGIVEDIITILAKLPDLVVTARNSTFVYKGQAVGIRQVGRDLSVRFVLEGSVRQVANMVRITGQLIDAEPGTQPWPAK